MRFIVDLYRYVIFAILGVLIIAFVFGGLQVMMATGAQPAMMATYMVGGLAVLLTLVMLLGLTATFISIHDRHVELVEAIHAWREDTLS